MTTISSYTEGDVTDVALCRRVGEVLQRHYPGHQWMVGIHDRSTGVMVIDLPYKPPSLRMWAYLLHIKNADDEAQIMRAGGEWLERLGMARAAAKEAYDQARENGLDLGNAVTKSAH